MGGNILRETVLKNQFSVACILVCMGATAYNQKVQIMAHPIVPSCVPRFSEKGLYSILTLC